MKIEDNGSNTTTQQRRNTGSKAALSDGYSPMILNEAPQNLRRFV